MAKLNVCPNGVPLTLQVIKYQHTGSDADYEPIKKYYDDFKAYWFKSVKEYTDFSEFESGYEFKTHHAVKAFDFGCAQAYVDEHNYTLEGMFNRFWYRIISNWCTNIRNSSFRPKTRPSLPCPSCGRLVTRVDAIHLQHYKTIRDLPKVFVWSNEIFEVVSKPRKHAVSWGRYSEAKIKRIETGDTDDQLVKLRKRIPWPWHDNAGDAVVICPFTLSELSAITNEYIQSLSDEYSRYSPPLGWEEFIERYPNALIQAKTYELDFVDGYDEDDTLRGKIVVDHRLGDQPELAAWEDVIEGKVPSRYEHLFSVIDSFSVDDICGDVLKLLSLGYNHTEIAERLSISKAKVQEKIKFIRCNHKELEDALTIKNV